MPARTFTQAFGVSEPKTCPPLITRNSTTETCTLQGLYISKPDLSPLTPRFSFDIAKRSARTKFQGFKVAASKRLPGHYMSHSRGDNACDQCKPQMEYRTRRQSRTWPFLFFCSNPTKPPQYSVQWRPMTFVMGIRPYMRSDWPRLRGCQERHRHSPTPLAKKVQECFLLRIFVGLLLLSRWNECACRAKRSGRRREREQRLWNKFG